MIIIKYSLDFNIITIIDFCSRFFVKYISYPTSSCRVNPTTGISNPSRRRFNRTIVIITNITNSWVRQIVQDSHRTKCFCSWTRLDLSQINSIRHCCIIWISNSYLSTRNNSKCVCSGTKLTFDISNYSSNRLIVMFNIISNTWTCLVRFLNYKCFLEIRCIKSINFA